VFADTLCECPLPLLVFPALAVVESLPLLVFRALAVVVSYDQQLKRGL
jgi:hypothetical protein